MDGLGKASEDLLLASANLRGDYPSADHPLRHSGAGSGALPVALGQGLVFTSRHYTRLVRSYGLKQEFISPHCPQQNGMVERVIRTLKEQCVHRHRFETQQHAIRVISDWIQFYNFRRPPPGAGNEDTR